MRIFVLVCISWCVHVRMPVYLSQQQALRLQLQLNSVFLVVQELLQLHVLQSAQRAVVLPVNSDLHLS